MICNLLVSERYNCCWTFWCYSFFGFPNLQYLIKVSSYKNKPRKYSYMHYVCRTAVSVKNNILLSSDGIMIGTKSVDEKGLRSYGYERVEILWGLSMSYIRRRTEQTNPESETWIKTFVNRVSYWLTGKSTAKRWSKVEHIEVRLGRGKVGFCSVRLEAKRIMEWHMGPKVYENMNHSKRGWRGVRLRCGGKGRDLPLGNPAGMWCRAATRLTDRRFIDRIKEALNLAGRASGFSE